MCVCVSCFEDTSCPTCSIPASPGSPLSDGGWNPAAKQRLWASAGGSSPIEHEAHELEVEGARKAEQAYPPGGVLFALAGLAEVAIVPLQLLLLPGEEKTQAGCRGTPTCLAAGPPKSSTLTNQAQGQSRPPSRSLGCSQSQCCCVWPFFPLADRYLQEFRDAV